MSVRHSITEKCCIRCELVKPISEYPVKGGGVVGFRSRCKPCEILENRERRRRRDVRIRAAGGDPNEKANNPVRNRHWILRGHGITPEIFAQILESQGGRCGICRSEDSGMGLGRTFCVDHDHVTGEVRGLLCRWCNIALSAFGDNLEGVIRVVDYLKTAVRLRKELIAPDGSEASR